jgi:hypothetical protein
MYLLRFLVTTAVLLTFSCKRQPLCRIEIQSNFDYVVMVTSVIGIGFSPFPNPHQPTDANITATVAKPSKSHSAPARIIIHDSPMLTYRDPSGGLHRPTVKIIKLHPEQKDFGYVRIVLQTPEEVLVYAGEMDDPILQRRNL